MVGIRSCVNKAASRIVTTIDKNDFETANKAKEALKTHLMSHPPSLTQNKLSRIAKELVRKNCCLSGSNLFGWKFEYATYLWDLHSTYILVGGVYTEEWKKIQESMKLCTSRTRLSIQFLTVLIYEFLLGLYSQLNWILELV